jgi:hypothetical protein
VVSTVYSLTTFANDAGGGELLAQSHQPDVHSKVIVTAIISAIESLSGTRGTLVDALGEPGGRPSF